MATGPSGSSRSAPCRTPGSSITYYLNMTWNLTQTVTDGPGSRVKAGPIITITNCPIEVHNFSS
jgi:hypothetical protein